MHDCKKAKKNECKILHNHKKPKISNRLLDNTKKNSFIGFFISCHFFSEDLCMDHMDKSDAIQQGRAIPTNADLFVAFSSDSPYKSYRSQTGSYFLQAFVKHAVACGNTDDLLHIMTFVINDVQKQVVHDLDASGRNLQKGKQSPCFKSFLGKLFYFPKISMPEGEAMQ